MTITGDHISALIRAIAYFGSQTKLAKALKVRVTVVNNWLIRDKTIPFQYACAIERKTKYTIHRYDLAPYARSIIEND